MYRTIPVAPTSVTNEIYSKSVFFGVEKNRGLKHKTYEAVRHSIKHNVHDLPHLRQPFEVDTESDDVEYNVNVFKGYYNLYSYNQYINNVYNSNKVKHFKRVLATHGFDIEEIGDVSNTTKISKASR